MKNYQVEISGILNDKLQGLSEAKAKLAKEKFEIKASIAFEKGSGKGGLPPEIEKRINEIKNLADELSRIRAKKGKDGIIDKYEVEWIDKAGKKYKEIYTAVVNINKEGAKTIEGWKLAETYTDDIAKNLKEVEKIQLSADKFLERAKTLEKTPAVLGGMDVAKKIKVETDPQQIRALYKELQTLDAGIRQSGHAAWSWGEQMKVAAQRALEWASVTSVLYGALDQLRQGVQYIKDLDKEMTNIQIATGLTKDETNKLAKEYNGLAKELRVGTLEVAKGAVTWLKQGKSVEEAGILIRDTAMLAKLGMIDTAEASEYLTSTLNGFQLGAEDASGVIDKLVAVDNAAATSVAELSVALSRSANVARISGVSFENLVAYIGTVSSVTRRSAESVGESFNWSI